MEIQKQINEEVVAGLEALSFEVEARKSVVSEMLAQNMDIETEAFNKYQGELVRYNAKYEKAKKEFQTQYVDCVPNAERWNLDFATGILTVTVQG